MLLLHTIVQTLIIMKCMFALLTLLNLIFSFGSKYIFLLASDGKTYDAYILCPKTPGDGSTSNSDIFVFKVLPEVLEKQCGYKLFICGRDDYVGESMYAVGKSKSLLKLITQIEFPFSGRLWHVFIYLTNLRTSSMMYDDSFHIY